MKFLTILVFICFLGVLVKGQKEKSAPLQLSVEIKDKNVCSGNSAQMNIELKNISSKPVVVDTNAIGKFTYYDRFLNKKRVSKDAFVLTIESHYEPNFVILQPKEMFTDNMESMDFTEAGKYKMQIGYKQSRRTEFENNDVWNGLLKSNPLFISVNNCAK